MKVVAWLGRSDHTAPERFSGNKIGDIMSNIIERQSRDKYGRTVRHLEVEWFKTLVVIVNMPKVYRDRYPGQNYLINNWQHPLYIDGVHQGEAEGKIRHAATLKEARAIAHSLINA